MAKHFNYTDFKQYEFNKTAGINSNTVYREFGSWEKALQFLTDRLKSKGINFQITIHRSRHRSQYTIQEMFDEMETIWTQLGHRPSRNEWTTLKPKISYAAIYQRFGGWTNACLKFIEYKSGSTVATDTDLLKEEPFKNSSEIKKYLKPDEEKR